MVAVSVSGRARGIHIADGLSGNASPYRVDVRTSDRLAVIELDQPSLSAGGQNTLARSQMAYAATVQSSALARNVREG